jgi:hypothetical protein
MKRLMPAEFRPARIESNCRGRQIGALLTADSAAMNVAPDAEPVVAQNMTAQLWRTPRRHLAARRKWRGCGCFADPAPVHYLLGN